MDDPQLTILLEYYKQARLEIDTAQKNQQSILSWSSVSIGGLLVASLGLFYENKILAFYFLVIIWPSVALMFLNLWLYQIAVIIRASRYVRLLENSLSIYIGYKTPGFEQWLRLKENGITKHFKFGHLAAISIYIGIITAAMVLANYIYWNNDFFALDYKWKLAFTFASFFLIYAICLYVRNQVNIYIINNV